jgi:hypothetical protein
VEGSKSVVQQSICNKLQATSLSDSFSSILLLSLNLPPQVSYSTLLTPDHFTMAYTARAFSFAALCNSLDSSSIPQSQPRPTRKKTKSTPRRREYCVSPAPTSGYPSTSCVFDEKLPTSQAWNTGREGKKDTDQRDRCGSWSNWLRKLGGRSRGNYDLLEKLPLPRERMQQVRGPSD